MRKYSIYLMGSIYAAAGIYHFVNPDVYVRIMPPWLPAHLELVYTSGAAEILLGLMLFFKKTKRIAGWGLIALLVAVFPANIQMAINYYNEGNPRLWVAIVRLPFQILLIWWAWKVARRHKRTVHVSKSDNPV